MKRRAVFAVGALLLAQCASVVSADLVSGAETTAWANADITPKDTIAGTTGAVYDLAFYNEGSVPLHAIRITRPTPLFTVTSAAPVAGGPAGTWRTTLNAPTGATFDASTSEPLLMPGQVAHFTITADVGTAATDQYVPWTVESSASPPPSYVFQTVPARKPGGLSGNLRVLEITGRFMSPSAASCPTGTDYRCADDGTDTAGEVVDVSTTLTNRGTGTVTLNAADSGISEVTAGSLSTDPDAKGILDGTMPTLAPGASATIVYKQVKLGTAGTNRRIRVKFANYSSGPVEQAYQRIYTLQGRLDFTPKSTTPLTRSLKCNDPRANYTGSIAPGRIAWPGTQVRCSILTDKSGDQAAQLSTGSQLVVDAGNGHVFAAPLESESYIAPGAVTNRRIQFASTLLPADFPPGTYPVTIRYRGTDYNGDPIVIDKDSGEFLVVDPPPAITGAALTSSGGRYSVTVTMSEPVTGTQDVRNWRYVDAAGVEHPVSVVSSSSADPTVWVLDLAATPLPFAPGTAALTYTARSAATPLGGDLHDSVDNPLPTTSDFPVIA